AGREGGAHRSMALRSRVICVVAAVATTTPFLVLGPAALPSHAAARPIKHILVLMQENRSFDSYFGKLHVQGQPAATPEPLDAKNPNPSGGSPIHAYHKHRYCEVADLDHSWNGAHHEYDHGRMDGFTRANVDPKDPTGQPAMGYYTRKDL